MSRECTAAKYLPEGYKLEDAKRGTIAVVIDGRFVRWAAGTWQPKRVRLKFKKLKTARAARKSAAINKKPSASLHWATVSRIPAPSTGLRICERLKHI